MNKQEALNTIRFHSGNMADILWSRYEITDDPKQAKRYYEAYHKLTDALIVFREQDVQDTLKESLDNVK